MRGFETVLEELEETVKDEFSEMLATYKYLRLWRGSPSMRCSEGTGLDWGALGAARSPA